MKYQNETIRIPDSEIPYAPDPVPETYTKSRKKTRKKGSGLVGRIIRRTLLLLFTLILSVFVGLVLVCNLIFNGPSTTARDRLTMSMRESSGMKWCPALFIGEDTVAEIEKASNYELPDELSDFSQIHINMGNSMGSASGEWDDCPDGIRLEEITGDTYNAYVMIIRDPSRVYLATSSKQFSTERVGARINEQIEVEGAVAAINAGAFLDDGTAHSYVGSVPEGLVVAGGAIRWTDGAPPEKGFVGFNKDNVLVVAQSMTGKKAMELGIRDGCEFGPVLIMNGEINEDAYTTNSGLNPRTAIGQRADGAVIFVCIDGRQVSSLGGTYGDVIDIMVEYGAVNACNLDGGSSTVMMYRDHETQQVSMVNSYSLLQKEPRRMPTFFMVRPASEDE